MKTIKYIITTLVLTIAVLVVVQVSASNMLSTDGIDLGRMQYEIAEVKKENTLLKEKIYTQASLNTVASQAATLGFIPEKSPEYIKTTKAIAIR